MNRDPSLSVVIPTFNRERTIARAVHSVLDQPAEGVEVVVVDDGSTDDTAAILKGIQDDRLVCRYQENQGRCVARNIGVHEAKGEFVLFLDSDDEMLANGVATFTRLAKSGKADLVCCSDEHYDSNGQLTRVDGPADLGPLYKNLVLNYQPGAFAIKRSQFLQIGGYLAELELCENTDLFIRLSQAAASEGWIIECCDTPVVRINEFGQTLSNNPNRLTEAISRILSEHAGVFAQHPAKLAQFCEIAGVNAAKAGDLPTARHFFFRAIKAYPIAARTYVRFLCTCSATLAKLVWTPGRAGRSASECAPELADRNQ